MPHKLTAPFQIDQEHFLDKLLVEGEMTPDREIGLRIDQTLTQDATGTLVMLELESMKLDRVRTEISVQYVDHNLVQEDFKNQDDHLFLYSACQRFGLWYSRPGNGVSHPLHQERFGKPGKSLLGSDSHTSAAGSIGMLAIGAGGLEVAVAMAGYPFHVPMPQIWGVKLIGELLAWVSAKDIILEMLRRHGVDGATGTILEYYGPGVDGLTVMDRHVIANMGAELGATTSVFPSDAEVRRFLKSQGREEHWTQIIADADASYDRTEEIDLSNVEPLIAMPSSPGNVMPVREVAGQEIVQSYIGSSANPGYRDFAIAAEMVKGKRIAPRVSFDVNPTSRQILENLIRDGHILSLVHAGARLHQAGCNGCIGMGQAPATQKFSLRTVPRNFPGRSGTREDKVCLVSPETATASAPAGAITDPRSLGMPCPQITDPVQPILNTDLFVAPLSVEKACSVKLERGPNIGSLPDLDKLPDKLELPILLKVGDDISTDEIMPAGARVLPFRSNIPKISQFVFEAIDPSYSQRATELKEKGNQRACHAVVAGSNYGQGSSREHAAIAPRYLGLRVVLAKSFARIHWQNLVNFGILPLVFADGRQYERLQQGDQLRLRELDQLAGRRELNVENLTQHYSFSTIHEGSPRQVEVLKAGSLINWMKGRIVRAPKQWVALSESEKTFCKQD